MGRARSPKVRGMKPPKKKPAQRKPRMKKPSELKQKQANQLLTSSKPARLPEDQPLPPCDQCHLPLNLTVCGTKDHNLGVIFGIVSTHCPFFLHTVSLWIIVHP